MSERRFEFHRLFFRLIIIVVFFIFSVPNLKNNNYFSNLRLFWHFFLSTILKLHHSATGCPIIFFAEAASRHTYIINEAVLLVLERDSLVLGLCTRATNRHHHPNDPLPKRQVPNVNPTTEITSKGCEIYKRGSKMKFQPDSSLPFIIHRRIDPS